MAVMLEHRLFLTKAIGIHADAGTQGLIAYFKSVKLSPSLVKGYPKAN